jgi:molybdate transport system substrate-binding protein
MLNRLMLGLAVLCLGGLPIPPGASAAELKVLTAGAFKSVLLAAKPALEAASGTTLAIDDATAGQIKKRIAAGETFDLVIAPPRVIEELAAAGKVVAGSRRSIARVGIGVMVREGAPRPEIGTTAAFRAALQAAKSVAYIDPASGGSSGIYLSKLFEKLGIADEIKAKAKLKKGGYVADLLVSGEAELGLHQISEIIPVKGVTLVGPLPAEVQSYTTYAIALSSGTRELEAASKLSVALGSEGVHEIIRQNSMEPAID